MADAAPVATIFVFCFLGLALLTKSVAFPGLDLRLSPGRAPPAFSRR